jgi:hypothetical protein
VRERLNELIARQHELGLKRSASARSEYVRVTIELLSIARSGINLSLDWKPDVPPPVRPNIETVTELAEAKKRLARLETETQQGLPGSFDAFRDLACQIRAVEGVILDRARREGVAA